VAKVVRSHLKVLVAEYELNNKRCLGIRTIATEAGVSVSTVQGLMNNMMKRVPQKSATGRNKRQAGYRRGEA
jgi:predicted transcriptional regulator